MTASYYHKNPTLPHLLNEYGFEDAIKERMRKTKEEERERRKAARKEKKRGKTFEEEKDMDKQKEMDEYYLKMVGDMYQLRDYYYNEYSQLLSDKVEKQRKELRERNAKMNIERERKEEEERKASHTVKKRLERHTLQTTPDTLAVPKTDLYYIIGLEEKLKREGKLKTPSDYQKFHADIQQPHIFYSYFKVRKHSDFTPYSDVSRDGLSSYSLGESNDVMCDIVPKLELLDSQQLKSVDQGKPHPESQQLRSLSRISESKENSRPNSRADNWAITQQFPSLQKSRKSIGSVQPVKSKAEQLSDLEKRFPKLEMPKLHCFSLNLAKKPPDPVETQLKANLKAKEKQRKQAARTYTKMYQLAMSNAAATARMMDTQEDMDFVFYGPDLCDVIADEHWMCAYGMSEADLVQEIPNEGDIDPTLALESRSSSSNKSISDTSSKATSTKSSRSTSAKSEKNEELENKEAMAPPLPLTLHEITSKCNTKESKSLSSLWTNYLKAGKSPWDIVNKEDD